MSLHWRGSGDRREVYDDIGQLVMVIYRAHTDAGPRWFAEAMPSRGVLAADCDTFVEAAKQGVEALARGDHR